MKDISARNNIIPYLKQVGIIDDENKPKERAKQWRDDQQYPKVCKDIINEVYPRELIDACPDPISDRGAAERWFSNETGAGQAAVRKMVAFYSLLSEADPSKAVELKKKKESTASSRAQAPVRKETIKKAKKAEEEPRDPKPHIPSFNLNLQIHISADASPDQIDKIFESMAKHIYRKAMFDE
jgi:hypothetical protein